MSQLFNIPLITLLILVIAAFVGYHWKEKFDFLFRFGEKEASKLPRIVYVFAGACFTMAIWINKSNDYIYGKYQDEYNWLNPSEYFRFPLDQIKIQRADNLPVVACDLASGEMKRNRYNLILTDYTGSTTNTFEDMMQSNLGAAINGALGNYQPSVLYNKDFTTIKQLPLLLMTSNLFTQPRDSQHFAFMAYMGRKNSIPYFKTYWAKPSDGPIFWKGQTGDFNSFVLAYNWFVSHYVDSLDHRHKQGVLENTDFSFIAQDIKHMLQLDREMKGLKKSDYVSITIISDFHHEDSLPTNHPISFGDVQGDLKDLFTLECIKQVNLIQLPCDKNYAKAVAEIGQLVELFRSENKCTNFNYIPVTVESAANPNTLKEIMAATANHEETEDSATVDIYYLPDGPSGVASTIDGRLRVGGLSHDGDTLQFKLAGAATVANLKLQLSEYPNSGSSITLTSDQFLSQRVHPNDILTLGLSNQSLESLKLYADHKLNIYSYVNNTEKTIKLSIKPLLSVDTCFTLLILYYLTIASICYNFTLYSFIRYRTPETLTTKARFYICCIWFMTLGFFVLSVFYFLWMNGIAFVIYFITLSCFVISLIYHLNKSKPPNPPVPPARITGPKLLKAPDSKQNP